MSAYKEENIQQLKSFTKLNNFNLFTKFDYIIGGEFTQLQNGEQAQYHTFAYSKIFPIPPEIASNITHYRTSNIFEWSEYSIPQNFIHLTFNSLTHLELITLLPLELLLTRFKLYKLPFLSHLKVDSFYLFAVRHNQTHKPFDLLPPAPKIDPVFGALRTITLTILPHGTFPLSPSMFPRLEHIKVNDFWGFEYNFLCEKCKHNRKPYSECYNDFFQSFSKWTQLKRISFGSAKINSQKYK